MVLMVMVGDYVFSDSDEHGYDGAWDSESCTGQAWDCSQYSSYEMGNPRYYCGFDPRQ